MRSKNPNKLETNEFKPTFYNIVNCRLLEDVDENTASWLSSTIGLASVIGRSSTGFVANYFHVYPLNAYIANQVTSSHCIIIMIKR